MISYRRGADGWIATAEVRVGVARRRRSVALGDLLDAPDPGGLWSAPVVTAPAALVELVGAGAARAGRSPVVVLAPASSPDLAAMLLSAVADGAEVAIVEDGGWGALTDARVLGGRPLPVLPLDNPELLGGLLGDLEVDVTLAIPAVDAAARSAARAALAPFEPEARHFLVEVDPRPAFDELGSSDDDRSLEELAAAAVGVFAGRLAATNRRWRRR